MRLKRLELWWRALWIRVLVRLMRRASARPDWSARPHRILFLRHDRAGDMILSTGVMRAIARSHPTITLDVLASPANAAILQAADYVHDVVVFDKKRLGGYLATARLLRRRHYDAVIDCMITAPSLTTLLLIWASGARQRVGISGRGNDAAFTVTVPPESRPNAHMVDLLAALARAFDVDPATVERQPVLTLTDAERARAEAVWGTRGAGRRVLVNVSAGTSARLWPDERYARVMTHVRARDAGATFRVISAPAETARGERVAREGGGTFVSTPSIRDAFALVAAADFVFTPDTSIAHAASAFRKPCVAMYLEGTSERWGLYGTTGLSVEHPGRNLDTLTVERMLEAVDAVWDAAFVSPRG
ncbi:MAG TPA: glycosyltransferase family 9 protein [Gemmatimonadaceae bacterium]|nr:glycosyltransferase family 9 protein [Gemmatimonadaceae bacterium]